MTQNPAKEKILNTDAEPVTDVDAEAIKEEVSKDPLAPFDPRLKKPDDGPLQSNQDPLNGVNE